MAEVMEFDFFYPKTSDKPSKGIIKSKIDLMEIDESKSSPETDLPEVLGEKTPHNYTLEGYFGKDALGKEVLQNKYLAPWEKSPYDMWKRVAKAISSIEKTEDQTFWYKKFFSILEDFRFVPGGRIMHGAGREDIITTLNNCYVVAIRDDSIQAIYDTIVEEALTYKFGGGCGHDLSILRPSGDSIDGTGGESCGPTGFMNLFSENTNTIAQHGRRGANMQTLRIDHPDIYKFIDIKRNLHRVKHSNISVLLTHKFMNAVENDQDFDLIHKGKVYHTIRAKELWNKIISAAHASGEPGILFWDTMKEYHNAEYCSPILTTNPCGEQPLPDGGCCNLGSINLERFVDDEGNFHENNFKKTVTIAVRFLDNIIDYNIDRHALEVQKQNARNDRRVGLGLLGLGDMLVKMKIRYDSDQALEMVDKIGKWYRDTAYQTSIDLAREKNPFPNFRWDGYKKSKFVQNFTDEFRSKIQKYGIRNSTILTVPPTGSGAIVARVTSGIEPIFSTSYTRRVKQNDGYGDTFKEFTVYHPIISRIFGNDENLPGYIVTAHDIDPYFRIKMQGIIQKYVDSSISSTVNLKKDIDVDTVADIYMTAYKAGLKGVTVYREGAREGILITNQPAPPGGLAGKENFDSTEQAGSLEDKKSTSVPERIPDTLRYGTGGMFHKSEKTIDQLGKESETATASRLKKKPRIRPSITKGITKRIRTGEGSLYITINEDEQGLSEIFTTIGKAGGNAAAQSEAISRLVSLALRSGIDVHDVIKQLKGISGPNPTWENGRLILSTPDAIGKALEDYLVNKNESNMENEEEKSKTPVFSLADETSENSSHIDADYNPRTMITCPDCGSTVYHENNCVICHSCGYSKCD